MFSVIFIGIGPCKFCLFTWHFGHLVRDWQRTVKNPTTFIPFLQRTTIPACFEWFLCNLIYDYQNYDDFVSFFKIKYDVHQYVATSRSRQLVPHTQTPCHTDRNFGQICPSYHMVLLPTMYTRIFNVFRPTCLYCLVRIFFNLTIFFCFLFHCYFYCILLLLRVGFWELWLIKWKTRL